MNNGHFVRLDGWVIELIFCRESLIKLWLSCMDGMVRIGGFCTMV